MYRFFLQYENGRQRFLIGKSFDDILENYVLKTDVVSFITNMNNGVVLAGVLNGKI